MGWRQLNLPQRPNEAHAEARPRVAIRPSDGTRREARAHARAFARTPLPYQAFPQRRCVLLPKGQD
jgi:hypothetical protein